LTNENSDNNPSRLPRPRRREFPAPLGQPLGPGRTARQTPAPLAAPTRAPEPEPDFDDEFDEYDGYYEPQRESMLRNPYVLAAIAVVGAIVMAVIVVALAGGGGGGGGGTTAMNTPNPLTQVPGATTVESISTATVRDGPGTEYNDLGVLSRGQKVSVTGRDADAKWFQIVFPQNSTSRGWVPASALKVSDINVAALAIATVTPRPLPPTSTFVPQPTAAPTQEATETPEAEPGPDLAVSMNCTEGATVVVTISNVGDVAVENRQATVSVSIGGQPMAAIPVTLQISPNESVSFPTSEEVTAPSTSVTVTLQGTPQDIDPSDNSDTCTLSSGTTPTPPSGTTPTQVATGVVVTPTPEVTTVSP